LSRQKLFRGGSGWISVARISGVIGVKVFCCVFSIYFDVIGFFLEYKCLKRWFPGLFCSVGRFVDEKMGWSKLG
jgi:hypothetical protein